MPKYISKYYKLNFQSTTLTTELNETGETGNYDPRKIRTSESNLPGN